MKGTVVRAIIIMVIWPLPSIPNYGSVIGRRNVVKQTVDVTKHSWKKRWVHKKTSKTKRQCQKYRINFKVRQYIVSFVDIGRYFIDSTRLIIIFIENKKWRSKKSMEKTIINIKILICVCQNLNLRIQYIPSLTRMKPG